MTDESGNKAQLLDYYPFGDLRLNETDALDEQRKFTGHEYDDDTDLTYANARYYDQGIGRFNSQDPVFIGLGVDERTKAVLANPQAMNSYSYARNNPLRFIDPLGLWEKETGKVEKGDTLSAITGQINNIYKTNYTYQEIAKLNEIADPNKIYVGDIIKPNEIKPDITNDLTSKMHENVADPKIQNPFYFKSKVQEGGAWDYKNQPGVYCSNQGCGGQQHSSYIFRGDEIDYDAPGNINYGYVGSNTWFGAPSVLHYFAGQTQNNDNNTNAGDPPEDTNYINYGIYLFNIGY